MAVVTAALATSRQGRNRLGREIPEQFESCQNAGR
jgi:hypothetical protein